MRHDYDDKPSPAEQMDELISVANRIANALEGLVANSFSLTGPGPNDPPPEPPPPPQPPEPEG